MLRNVLLQHLKYRYTNDIYKYSSIYLDLYFNGNIIYEYISRMKYHHFDKKQILTDFEMHKERLLAITMLQENDKISFDDEYKIYIDRGHSLQFIKRWYYGENKEKTIKYLALVMGQYIDYIDKTSRLTYFRESIKTYGEFMNQLIIFNEELINGLVNLYKTYEQIQGLDDVAEKKLIELLTLIKTNNNDIFIINNKIKNFVTRIKDNIIPKKHPQPKEDLTQTIR